eukprot:238694_1
MSRKRGATCSIVLISLLFVLFHPLQTSNFTCNDEYPCTSSVYKCQANEDCFILCDGDSSCEDKTFFCPDNGECTISCGTNMNQQKACYNAVFFNQIRYKNY